MGKGLKPDYYMYSLYKLTPSALKQAGIGGLLLDIDNTLVPNRTPEPDDKVLAWMRGMQAAGIRLMIVSNATDKRVVRFNGKAHLECRSNAMKPLRHAYAGIAADWKLRPDQILMAGDQLFTDILGANRAGMKSLLLVPITNDDPPHVKAKRLLEKLFLGGLVPRDNL